jgi:hypothetical protein
LTKKEKTGFFLLCGKQAKINTLIFLIFLYFIHPACDRMGFVSSLGRSAYADRLRLLTKKEKTGFFLLCGKQAKINALILLIFLLYFIYPACDRMGFVSSLGRSAYADRLRLLTKKEKTGFFLLCGKQAKINTLIFLIFLYFTHPACDRMGFVSSLGRSAYADRLFLSSGFRM